MTLLLSINVVSAQIKNAKTETVKYTETVACVKLK
jgi:hypothetical protein